MCGRPTLWQDPDFTTSKKLVPHHAIVSCIRRSRNQLRSVHLGRVAKPEEAIMALSKSCHRMHTLQIENGEYFPRWSSHLAVATRLTNVTFGDEISICMTQTTQLMTLCPMLKSFTARRVRQNMPMGTLEFGYHGLESLSLKAEPIQSHFGMVAPPLEVASIPQNLQAACLRLTYTGCLVDQLSRTP